MKSIKESLLASLNEGRSSRGTIRKAIEAAHKLFVNVSDDDWNYSSLYDMWMFAEEVANDEELFDEWYENSSFNKTLSYDEARVLMSALYDSYDYLELELRGENLFHKILRKVSKDEYEFISEILPYGIEDYQTYKKR